MYLFQIMNYAIVYIIALIIVNYVRLIMNTNIVLANVLMEYALEEMVRLAQTVMLIFMDLIVRLVYVLLMEYAPMESMEQVFARAAAKIFMVLNVLLVSVLLMEYVPMESTELVLARAAIKIFMDLIVIFFCYCGNETCLDGINGNGTCVNVSTSKPSTTINTTSYMSSTTISNTTTTISNTTTTISNTTTIGPSSTISNTKTDRSSVSKFGVAMIFYLVVLCFN